MYNVVHREIASIGRFQIELDTVEKNGSFAPYSFIKMRPGVTVISFLDDENIMLLKEYRHAIKQWEKQIPSGIINAEEKPENAARREFEEETGYELSEIVSLGNFYPSFGSTDEIIYLFCGKSKSSSQNSHRDLLEEIKLEIVSVKKFEEMIKRELFGMEQVLQLG